MNNFWLRTGVTVFTTVVRRIFIVSKPGVPYLYKRLKVKRKL